MNIHKNHFEHINQTMITQVRVHCLFVTEANKLERLLLRHHPERQEASHLCEGVTSEQANDKIVEAILKNEPAVSFFFCSFSFGSLQ